MLGPRWGAEQEGTESARELYLVPAASPVCVSMMAPPLVTVRPPIRPLCCCAQGDGAQIWVLESQLLWASLFPCV